MSEQDWPLRAACRGVPIARPFAPKNSAEEQNFIAGYCRRPCPVRRECLAFAMTVESTLRSGVQRYGVFGGLTGQQRAGLARRGVRVCVGCRRPFMPSKVTQARCRSCGRTYVAGPVREHGGVSGYAQHIRRGERPCDPCRTAKNAYDRSRRSVRGAA